jgi:hypothetical protein
VLAELDALPDSADEDGDVTSTEYEGDDQDDVYQQHLDEEDNDETLQERSITISFSDEIWGEHGCRYARVSVRFILECMALALPLQSTRLRQIREDFYGGDSTWDHHCDIDEMGGMGGTRPSSTTEERAILRVARAKNKPRRDALRGVIETDNRQKSAESERKNARYRLAVLSFDPEDARLRAELEKSHSASQALEKEWEDFVLLREGWGDDRANREASRRAELIQKEQNLRAEREAIIARRHAVLVGDGQPSHSS